MRNKWNIGLTTSVVAALTMSLVGCGTSSNRSTQQASGGGTAQAAAQKTKPLVISAGPNGNFQDNFNPFSTTCNPGTQGLLYEPLFYYSQVGSQKYGILGKKMTWSNANRTLTVQLRANVKWTDGQPFSAKDVAFTFAMLKKYPAADLSSIWSELSSVQAVGSDKVVFQFKKADVPFAMYVLQTYIVPKHIWATLGNPVKASVTKPVGTGPYILKSFSSEDYKLTANLHYYHGKPQVPEVDFPAYASNDSADLALANGNLNWTGIFIPNIDQVYTSKNSHNKYWFAPGGVNLLMPNLKNPLLSQKVVRQAISMAINRNAISQKGEYGYERVASPTAVVLPTYQNWLDPNLPKSDTQFTYDPSRAEQLLERAGYQKNHAGIFVSPSGKALSFTLIVPSGWTDWDEDCQLMADQLKQVGIDIKVHEEQDAAYQNQLSAHTFELALASSSTGPGPYYVYQGTFASTGSMNYEQWHNAATDQALADFAKTTNGTQQKQDIYRVERIMAEQLPTIPITCGAFWYEYNDSTYTGWPDAAHPYVTPSPFSYPAEEIVLMHLHPIS